VLLLEDARRSQAKRDAGIGSGRIKTNVLHLLFCPVRIQVEANHIKQYLSCI
jgi:hypothetical protein